MITANDLIRNRARLRMGDRILADRMELARLRAFLQPWHGDKHRRIELLTKRIEFCTTLRNNL